MLLAAAAPATGQPRRAPAEPPNAGPWFFADPATMLEGLFGSETDEERAALEAIEVSVREERQVGGEASRAYLADLRRRGIRVVSRGDDVRYLERLVETLRPRMRHHHRYPRISVFVADSDATDARSFPGGTLIFFQGLLDFAGNEAALVGVVGHELSHLDHGHQLDNLRRVKLAQRTFAGGQFRPEEFFRNGMLVMSMFTRPFRPEQEAAADGDGAKWAYESGYDPREMAELFRRMHERTGPAGAALPAFLRSHPYHLERHRAVLQLYDQLQAAEPRDTLYVGRQNLARRTARSEREFEGETVP